MTDGFPSNGASFAQTQAELLQDRDNLPFVINPGTATLCVGRAGSAEPTCSAHCIAFPTINGAVPPGHRGGRRGDFSVESRRESAAVQVAELLGVSLPQRTVYPPASLAGPLLTYGSSFSWSDSPSGNADGEPLIGDEALRLWNEEAYCLFWPMREGRLNVGAGTSLQQVKDALEKIWGNALEGLMEDLNLEPSSSWSELSVVLLVPLTLSPREIKEMVDVLLINLGFGSLVLHVEAVAAAFGGGLSAACVVHLGRHSSSVCCVEDASLLPSTWRLLLYGVDDVADVLLWLLKRIGEWPPAANFDPWRSARDQNSLVHMVNHAFVPLEGELCRIQHLIRQRPAVPMCLHHSVTGGTRLQLPLSVAACMAPYAYLYPALLDPPRPAPGLMSLEDHEDLMEAGWMGERLPSPRSAAALMGDRAHAGAPSQGTGLLGASAQGPASLAQAVVESICCLPSSELQKLLFMNILVTGAGSCVPGFMDALEEEVLNNLPREGAMETVNVVQPLEDPRHLAWRGGTLLGALDSEREIWVTREEWLEARQEGRRNDDLNPKLFIYANPQR
eukprot:jgi/Botrbrau1/7571/Bobra.0159s0021.1